MDKNCLGSQNFCTNFATRICISIFESSKSNFFNIIF